MQGAPRTNSPTPGFAERSGTTVQCHREEEDALGFHGIEERNGQQSHCIGFEPDGRECTGGRDERATALANGTPLQRFWRDAHAGRVHAANEPERAYLIFGNNEFGLPPADTMV